jgi:F-type H+-transporting ATPase subunit delta
MIYRYARPYAQALMGAAGSVERAEATRDDLVSFAEAMRTVPRLGRMASNPGVPPATKRAVVDEIADMLEARELTRRLLRLLLDNYRLVHLPAILEAIDELIDRARGVVSATVTAAQELDADQQARLQGALERLSGAQVRLEAQVDPSLIGGFVAQFGSNRYDASVRGQLAVLESRLTAESPTAAAVAAE